MRYAATMGDSSAPGRRRFPHRRPRLALLLARLCLLTLAACGGGGGGGDGGNSFSSTPGTSLSVSGSVHKGPVSGASVQAYRVASDGRGSLLDSATTDADGSFSIEINDYSGPIWLEAANGSYTDEATGSTTPLVSVLRAIIAGGVDVAQVTLSPLTEIAARQMGILTAAEINRINGDISALFFTGADTASPVSIIGTRPANLLDATAVATADAASIDYGLVLAGLALYAANTSLDLESVLAAVAEDAENASLELTLANLQAGVDGFLLGANNAGVPLDHRLGSQGGDLLLGSGLSDNQAPAGHGLVLSSSIVGVLNQAGFGLTIVNGELFAGYRLTLDDSSPAIPPIVIEGRIESGSEAITGIDLTEFNDGNISVELLLTDVAGNSAAPVTANLTKDSGSYSVAGTISLAPGTQVDSDVNTVREGGNANVANNSFAEAQQIFSPGVLGGYVNVINTGPDGQLRASGDEDFFRVELSGGEQILLRIGDAATDLDLELYDSGVNMVADSLGTDITELISVNQPGTYFIRVYPFSGASNYVLSIGLPVTTAANEQMSPLSSFDLFEDNEVILTFDGEPPGVAIASRIDELEQLGVRPAFTGSVGGKNSRAQLMTFPAAGKREDLMARVGAAHRMFPGKGRDAAQRQRQQTLAGIKALRRLPGVRSADANYRRSIRLVPNDSYYGLQWTYPQIRLPEAWDITTGNSQVIVAVADTGILPEHPDLAGQLVAGYDLISSAERAGDGDGPDSDPTDEGSGDPNERSIYHGSHVAGTIAAASNNAEGVAGVAWQTRIMPVRVLTAESGTSYDLMQGMLYAAGLPNNSGTVPTVAADIINLSVADPGASSFEQDVVDRIRERGVIMIAAAGNASSSDPQYPAAYDGVVSVSAVNQRNLLAGYSSFGASIDVAAPGGDLTQDSNNDGNLDGVLSTVADDSDGSLRYGYAFFDGTSMATPHVAGVAALMKAVRPGLTPAEFDLMLAEGRLTDDLGAVGRDDSFGHGLINAFKAVSSALDLENDTQTELPPKLVVNPALVDFGSTLSSVQFSLSNGGDGQLTINSVQESTSWLSLSADDTLASGLGSYRLDIDRSGLSPGLYQTNVVINSSAGQMLLPVRMRVSSTPVVVDAGTQFVTLVDAVSNQILFDQELNASNGQYQFSFDGVAAGEYLLRAGSDNDNDFFICDEAEACGAYPNLNFIQVLRVDRNRQVNFSSGYGQGLLQVQQADTAVVTGNAVRRSSAIGHSNSKDQ